MTRLVEFILDHAYVKFSYLIVIWIMGYVSFFYFDILINSLDSNFLKSTKVLRHGFLFIPFYFLLVVEGLNKPIKEARIFGV